MSLSPRARGMLREAAQALRHEPRVKKRRSKVVDEIAKWCAQHDIELGAQLSHDRLWLDAELLSRIDVTLVALGEPLIDADLTGLTSTEQACHGSLEAKGVRVAPRARRVLVSLPPGELRPGFAAEPRDYRDIDWCSLDLHRFDVLIQVENLDSFYAFMPGGATTDHWRQPLVVYRGDRHYGGGFADLAEAWAAGGRPHLYVGDFDACGVGFALSSQATQLLLPPLGWLKRHAVAEHLPAEQMTAQSRLRELRASLGDDHPLSAYLSIILDEQRGLRQQWFGEQQQRVPLG